MEREIYDIYVTNVSIVKSSKSERTDRMATQDALFRAISNYVILEDLVDIVGLVDLVKIPKYCEEHDGTTYVAFVRFDKPENHREAVKMINERIKFYNRKLVAKLNDVCSGDGQWHRSGNELRLFDNQRVYYHGEKVKYIKKHNDLMEGKEARIVMELREELEKEKKESEVVQSDLKKTKGALERAERKIAELLEDKARIAAAAESIGEANKKMAKDIDVLKKRLESCNCD